MAMPPAARMSAMVAARRTVIDVARTWIAWSVIERDLVAEAAQVADRQAGARELAPQPGDVELDCVEADLLVVEREQLFEDALLRHHAAAAPHQDLQHAELAARELQRHAGDAGGAAGGVERHIAVFDHAAALAAAAADQGARARLQLAQVERLHQVVVGADVERADAVLDLAPRGHHQDRRRVLRPAHRLQEIEAGAVWQVDVEDHQVVVLDSDSIARGPAPGHAVDRMAAAREVGDDRFGDVFGVFDQQNAQRPWVLPSPKPQLSHRARRGDSFTTTSGTRVWPKHRNLDVPTRKNAFGRNIA